MNYLAHLALSERNWVSYCGSLLPDFAPVSQWQNIPIEMRNAVEQHLLIDSFIDGHQLCKEYRGKYLSQYPRHGGIVMDVVFDHFLARHWDRYYPETLVQFCDAFYFEMERYIEEIPERLQRFIKGLLEYRWLEYYGTMQGVEQSLLSISRRIKSPQHFHRYPAIIEENYEMLEFCFLQFYPELLAELS